MVQVTIYGIARNIHRITAVIWEQWLKWPRHRLTIYGIVTKWPQNNPYCSHMILNQTFILPCSFCATNLFPKHSNIHHFRSHSPFPYNVAIIPGHLLIKHIAQDRCLGHFPHCSHTFPQTEHLLHLCGQSCTTITCLSSFPSPFPYNLAFIPGHLLIKHIVQDRYLGYFPHCSHTMAVIL